MVTNDIDPRSTSQWPAFGSPITSGLETQMRFSPRYVFITYFLYSTNSYLQQATCTQTAMTIITMIHVEREREASNKAGISFIFFFNLDSSNGYLQQDYMYTDDGRSTTIMTHVRWRRRSTTTTMTRLRSAMTPGTWDAAQVRFFFFFFFTPLIII